MSGIAMMYLLDTDHLTLLERGGSEAEPVHEHLACMPPQDVATTIISYEEQTRGWMSYLAKAISTEAQVQVYRRLREHLRTFCGTPTWSSTAAPPRNSSVSSSCACGSGPWT